MGVSTSCPAKPPPVDVHLSNFFVRLYFYFCCCTDIVFLWKCNGICGILKYGFQKSQTLAVTSDAEFPLQIPGSDRSEFLASRLLGPGVTSAQAGPMCQRKRLATPHESLLTSMENCSGPIHWSRDKYLRMERLDLTKNAASTHQKRTEPEPSDANDGIATTATTTTGVNAVLSGFSIHLYALFNEAVFLCRPPPSALHIIFALQCSSECTGV